MTLVVRSVNYSITDSDFGYVENRTQNSRLQSHDALTVCQYTIYAKWCTYECKTMQCNTNAMRLILINKSEYTLLIYPNLIKFIIKSYNQSIS